MIISNSTYNQRRIARINETVEMYVTPDRPHPPLEETLLLKSTTDRYARATRAREAPRALAPLGAFSTTLEPMPMGVACCAEPMVTFRNFDLPGKRSDIERATPAKRGPVLR